MLSLGQIKSGYWIMHNNTPHQVLSATHTQMGRGGANLKTKLRNPLTQAVIEHTFSGNVRMEEAPVGYRKVSFLYKDSSGFHFMDSTTFEQFQLEQKQLGGVFSFLAEGAEADLLLWEDKPIGVKLPASMVFTVAHTEPGLRGDTVSGAGTKPATIETGATVQVPLFIKTSDKIRVNTETGAYVERA